jgi:alpha-amylase
MVGCDSLFALTDRFQDGDTTNNNKVDKAAKGTYHGGDWQGLIDRLDYLEALGVNALWISPPNNNVAGFVTGAGFPDWAYHGIGPRISRIPRSTSGRWRSSRSWSTTLTPGGFAFCSTSSSTTSDTIRDSTRPIPVVSPEHRCEHGWNDERLASWLADLKTEDPEVANYLTQAWIAWIDKTGVDGFRVDTAKHVEHPFWKDFRKAILEKHPGFFCWPRSTEPSRTPPATT